MQKRGLQRFGRVVVLTAFAVLTATHASAADELKVGGDVLHGTIDRVTASTIEFSSCREYSSTNADCLSSRG